jgi:WXG100 family type VII secretion target
MSILGIDYDAMRAVADRLDGLRGELGGIIDAGAGQTQALKPDWRGFAADVFATESASGLQRMMRAPQMLGDVAAALRRTADIVQEAEEAARRRIEEEMRRNGWHG